MFLTKCSGSGEEEAGIENDALDTNIFLSSSQIRRGVLWMLPQ